MTTTRRAFLIGGIQVAVAAPLAARFATVRASANDEAERVLVVVQLTGGNDGLNTVVPHRQDAYYRLRPSLALSRGALHALDDDHGLHPSLGALGGLFAAGRLAVVHGVGAPQPDRSHFRSLDVWHTAELAPRSSSTGWLGRLADQVVAARPDSLAALFVGGGSPPRALAARAFQAPSLADENALRLADGPAGLRAGRAALLAGEPASDELAFLRDAARGTYAAAARLAELGRRPDRADYPGTALAARLRLVARLLAGGLGTRVVQVELGGFDTHARQARTHAQLLDELSGALAAFQADLAASGIAGRVATLVFSEFGRRARENGSGGTDHGAGAPVFVLGAAVRGGVHGTPPDLERLIDGDVPATTDLRAVYAALERDWMRLAPSTRDVAPLALVHA
jgi:uncharacterized protein (DUF1501 family)